MDVYGIYNEAVGFVTNLELGPPPCTIVIQKNVVNGYPLVNVYITMENHHVQWENQL